MAKKLGLDKLINEEPEPEPEPEPIPEAAIAIKTRRTDANRPLKPVKLMSLSKGFVGKVRPPRTKEEIEEERIAKSKVTIYLLPYSLIHSLICRKRSICGVRES